MMTEIHSKTKSNVSVCNVVYVYIFRLTIYIILGGNVGLNFGRFCLADLENGVSDLFSNLTKLLEMMKRLI